jgi:cytochrome P450
MNQAVEEMLRYDSPVTNSGRNVQRELSVRGCPMHLGESVTVSLAAANHDPEANPDPQRFDIERPNIQHQSFGGGKHTCLGAPLARVEAQEGIAARAEVSDDSEFSRNVGVLAAGPELNRPATMSFPGAHDAVALRLPGAVVRN